MEKRYLRLLIVGIIAGFVIGFASKDYLIEQFNIKTVEESVKKFYELALPGSSVNVESIKKEGEIYKFLLKVSSGNNQQYLEAWVTKDGRILTENVIYLQESIQNIEKFKKFVECLNSKGVKIFGVLDTNRYQNEALLTWQLLNSLGRYSYMIFVNCDNNVDDCKKIGIKSFPATIYDNKIYEGLLTINQISQITGCTV